MSTVAFELEQVHKRYGRSEALRGVSLRGLRGQVTGLLGPNGAGKTTAIKCLAGLVHPTQGAARIGGLDARRARARVRLGYLPERPRYATERSAVELMEREGRLFGLSRARRRARSQELLERVELPGHVAVRRVGTYSKGERARLGIALALVNDPEVVLLDEPTDGLDPHGRRAVRRLTAQLKDEDRAVLLNSHQLTEVEACCDALVILHRGAVVRAGSLAELTAAARRYSIRLAEPLPDELAGRLAELVSGLDQEGARLTFQLDQEPALDGVIDLLRSSGASVRELRAERLEDAFLAWVDAGDAVDSGGQA